MRSLFFKIFLWFWLANTVVIGVLALVVWLSAYFRGPPPRPSDRLHAIEMGDALAIWEVKGEEAFLKRMAELEKASSAKIFWIDEEGRQLNRRRAPAELLEFSWVNREKSFAGEIVISEPPYDKMIIPAMDSTGRQFRALVQFSPESLGGGSALEMSLNPRVMIPLGAAAVIAAGVGCYGMARYLTSPLRRLQGAARELASGDLSARVGGRLASRRDEIGELGREFDRMAGRVETLVTSQTRLVRDVSHELRSPLARLLVALELAARDAGETARPALGRVGAEAEKLNQLIGQLLSLARMESGAAEPRREAVDLSQLVEQVSADARFEAEAAGKRVDVTRCDACTVSGDAELLRSAIENVMRNAVRYTAAGSGVEISLGADGGEAVLVVRDHGPGVPTEELERIFRPFHRVSDARERESGGAGLGLAITERAVRLHGGTVTAENADGGGLVVRIRIGVLRGA